MFSIYCFNVEWSVISIFIIFGLLVYLLVSHYYRNVFSEYASYKKIFPNISDATWVFDRTTNKIIHLELIGDSANIFNIDEYLNKTLDEIMPHCSLKYVNNMLSKIDKGVLPPNIFDLQIYHNKPELIWIRVTTYLRKNEYGVSNTIYAISRNIDTEKKAELQLQTIHKRYKMILEGTKDTIWTININSGLFTYVSISSIRNFGFTPDEFVGKKTLYDIIAPPYINEFFKMVYDGIENFLQEPNDNPHISIEVELYHKLGHKIWVELSATILHNEQGVLTEILGITSRIDTRKETEKKILEQQEELKQANASKDKFFSIISHDLRNPITALVNIAETFDSFYLNMSYEEIRKSITILLNSANHTYKLLENLLEWARSATGQIEYKPQKWNIVEFATDAIDSIKAQAYAKRINIDIKYNEKCDYNVICDLNMIITVIRNLLSNSIKFSLFDANISVDIRKYNEDTNYYQISIIDSGVGIPQDKIPKLFDIENKTSTKGTNNEKGTGLGLVLIKEFINRHKCKIWVESELGKGTTFSFTLQKANAGNLFE